MANIFESVNVYMLNIEVNKSFLSLNKKYITAIKILYKEGYLHSLHRRLSIFIADKPLMIGTMFLQFPSRCPNTHSSFVSLKFKYKHSCKPELAIALVICKHLLQTYFCMFEAFELPNSLPCVSVQTISSILSNKIPWQSCMSGYDFFFLQSLNYKEGRRQIVYTCCIFL